MSQREDIRNVAIVAHVDHGKTTLVDALLRQTGAFGAHQELTDRVMDSGDLEREKGITILAKNTAVRWGGVKLNIVDTPGHADFGGEVERGLTMVDGVLLLVDASEGPLPQTRFVLRKTLEARLPVVLVVNKVDRADARIAEVVHQVEELFLDLDADEHQIDFPILYANARAGWVSEQPGVEGVNVEPLFRTIIRHVPPPSYEEGAPLQALVCNLSASPYVGRLAICRVHNGTLVKGGNVGWCRLDGTVEKVKVTELYVTEALEQVPAESAGPGEIVSVAGLAEVTIGETLADAEVPVPLPAITVDEPSLAMTIGINTSPLAGTDGTKMTARLLKARLDAELVGNVAIRVAPTEWPDRWEVLGRGELQLAVLVETMRREGFELTVGKPQVVTREIDGRVHEPVERVSVDVPEEYLGVVTQLLALRKGTMMEMVNHGTGWVRLDYRVPARGLIGFRTEFLTETRGTGILHHVFDGWAPWHGELRTRRNGSMVADRRGMTTTFALMNLQERGTLIVGPAQEVYEGMIVGENARAEEMDVNPTKEKKLTNMRSSVAEEFERLTPSLSFSLEHALEFIAEDECVEVTPKAVRLRKVVLDQATRGADAVPGPGRRRPGDRRPVGIGGVGDVGVGRGTERGVRPHDGGGRRPGGGAAVLRVAGLRRTGGGRGLGRRDGPLHGDRRLGGGPRDARAGRGAGPGSPGGAAAPVPPPRGGRGRRGGVAGPNGVQPRLLPGVGARRHAGAPGGQRSGAAQRGHGLPRTPAGIPRRAGCRRRAGGVGHGIGACTATVRFGPLRPWHQVLPPTIGRPGGMAERTNAQLLKSCEAQASVGSNPTPSAHCGRAFASR